MRRWRDFGVTGLLVPTLLGACTPGALSLQQLSPVHDANVTTASDLYARADSTTRAAAPPNASQVVILHSDSVTAALSFYELKDIFWVDVYIYNAGSTAFVIYPSQLVLMDASRIAFRELRPDEAANIYRSQVTNIPPYQPKYTYDVQTSTQGYVTAFGNSAYYTENSQSTVTPQEDPYNALGYSIGASIAESRNRKFLNMASTLYNVGFVEGSSIPGKTGAHGGIYWLKQGGWTPPVILRFTQSDYEVRFLVPPSP